MGIGNRAPSGNFFAENIWKNTSTDPSRYASALYKVFFCYDGTCFYQFIYSLDNWFIKRKTWTNVVFYLAGWANLTSVVGELKDPLRNVPRASIGGVSIVTFLYTMVNLSYLAVLPYVVILETAENPNVSTL